MALPPYRSLEQEFRRIHAFRGAANILRWDAAVVMPKGSAAIRGEQLAALDAECHTIVTSPRTSQLLDRAEANEGSLDDWQIANLREMRRLWQRATAMPKRLVGALAQAQTEAEMEWRRARELGEFSILQPHLEKLIPLVREKARRVGERLGLAPYDALLDEHDPGLKADDVEVVFSALTERLPGLIDYILEHQAAEPPLAPLGEVPVRSQRKLARHLMTQLGFPFDRGRLDESEHPFTEGVPGDIRITARFDKNDLLTGLMAVMHETGHAMYDFGLPEEWHTQPVGRDRGMTLHESQALFLEMVIGRSRPFLVFFAALARRQLNVDGAAWEPANLYRHANRVRRSLIRVDADEATYPLHIVLRHDLEERLLSGDLAVKDLPEAWNDRMQQRLGITPPTQREGCLQDVHWSLGYFGYFATYALGAIVASQIYQAMLLANPGVLERISAGDFAPMLNWLRDNIHRHAARMTSSELVAHATGRHFDPGVYLEYLDRKYLADA